jgi:hypothetical protein
LLVIFSHLLEASASSVSAASVALKGTAFIGSNAAML